MNIEIAKPSKRDRAKARAVSRLTKALELAGLANMDAEMMKSRHDTRMAVARASDAVREALKAIFDDRK